MGIAKTATQENFKSKFEKTLDLAIIDFHEKHWQGALSRLKPFIIDEADKNKNHPNNLYWKAATLFIACQEKGLTIADRKKVMKTYMVYIKSSDGKMRSNINKIAIEAKLNMMFPTKNKSQSSPKKGNLTTLSGHIRGAKLT